MKRKRIVLLIFILVCLVLGLIGCSQEPDDDVGLKVYTSFYTMYDFTSKLAGDKVSVHNMVPAGVDVHDWEPAASDIVDLERADMFVYNGAGMEHWVEDVLKTLENKDLVIVQASMGIDLLENGEDYHEAHDHEQDHDHGDFDPHVWLDPQNAKIQMENIAAGLIEVDPGNKDYYKANLEKYTKELEKLDDEFSTTISALSRKDLVVSHQAFSYLCKAYGLNQLAVDGISPESEPNPARMAEIIDFVQANDVKVIFFEELASPKLAKTISDATGAEVDVLNPLEGLSEDEITSKEDYFSVMRKNLAAIKRALQ